MPLFRNPRQRRAPRALGLAVAGVVACCLVLAGCSAPGGSTAPLSGHVLAAGSTALQPLVQKAATLFHQQNPHVSVEVQGGGSKTGLQAVNGHRADIGDSDIYADPALYPDPNLTDHLVAVIPFTVIANSAIGVKSLTTQQLLDIFSTGKLHNWKDVGGPDQPIVPVVRPKTSGTRATFDRYILGGRDENGDLLESDSSQTVIQTVAKTPGAVGYIGVSVLDTTVRQVAIDGLLPTPKSIESGKYQFWGFEHMYTLGDGDGPVTSFVDFMLSAQVQQLAQQLGYLPIADMQLATPASAAAAPSLTAARRKEEVEHA